jgi:hypothetical protein
MTTIDLVKAELLRAGRIRALDAIYHLTEPGGRVHRITRLAATIHTLRHREGWEIVTRQEAGRLAEYELVSTPGPPVPHRLTFGCSCPSCRAF